jgi:hypothetical protein
MTVQNVSLSLQSIYFTGWELETPRRHTYRGIHHWTFLPNSGCIWMTGVSVGREPHVNMLTGQNQTRCRQQVFVKRTPQTQNNGQHFCERKESWLVRNCRVFEHGYKTITTIPIDVSVPYTTVPGSNLAGCRLSQYFSWLSSVSHGEFRDGTSKYVTSASFQVHTNTLFMNNFVRGTLEKFVDSLYCTESELCGGAVTVSFSKYLPWQAMHFLQRSTHFSKTCCRPSAASFWRIAEQAVLTFHVRFSVSKALLPFENRRSSHCIVSIGLMDKL